MEMKKIHGRGNAETMLTIFAHARRLKDEVRFCIFMEMI